MKLTVQVYDSNDDSETSVEFPAKHEVCPRCDGHGTHLTPSIGNYAYTAEEFYDSFPEEEDREEYFRRGGIYDVVCEKCKGKNVIAVIDEDACLRSETLKPLYETWLKQENDRIEADREWRSEQRHEAMMLGEYEYGYSDY